MKSVASKSVASKSVASKSVASKSVASKSVASKSVASTILVTGPESSGKTTLARQLAWALDGLFVAEAARDYLELRGGDYIEADLLQIWRQQAEAEDTARASSASFVVCDTGPEVIRVWAETKYGRCSQEVLKACTERTYDLTLLCMPDLPWVPDPLRENPETKKRRALFDRYLELLSSKKLQVIQGEFRLSTAFQAILDTLNSDT